MILGFQTCQNISICCLRPQSWFFVMAFQANQYRRKPVFTQPFKSHRTFFLCIFLASNFLLKEIRKRYQVVCRNLFFQVLIFFASRSVESGFLSCLSAALPSMKQVESLTINTQLKAQNNCYSSEEAPYDLTLNPFPLPVQHVARASGVDVIFFFFFLQL